VQFSANAMFAAIERAHSSDGATTHWNERQQVVARFPTRKKNRPGRTPRGIQPGRRTH